MGKNSGNQIDEAVLSYLKGTNRPYSINDIVNNLQGKYSKAVITKAVDNVVEGGDVIEKINGKQKYYFYSQDKIQLDENKLKEVEENIKIQDAELAKLRTEINAKDQKLKLLKQHIPIEDLEKKLAALEALAKELQKKAGELTKKCENVDPEEQAQVKKKRQVYIGEWRKRKRLANEMLGPILENASKPKKAMIEEIGIETDEDNDAKLPN